MSKTTTVRHLLMLSILAGGAATGLLVATPARAQSSEPSERAAHQTTPASSAAETTPSSVRFSLGGIVGTSFKNKGLEYGGGFGVRPAMTIHGVYVGGMLAVHSGDDKDVRWPATATTRSGTQTYSSTPVVVEADLGYRIGIPLGSLKTAFTPFVTAGLLTVSVSSRGVFGDASTSDSHGIFGAGAAYELDFGAHIFAGAMFRLHRTVDGDFKFGSAPGFTTSLWYGAAFSELGYRF